MARKFRELETRMSPEAIQTATRHTVVFKASMVLEELGDALRMTQQNSHRS